MCISVQFRQHVMSGIVIFKSDDGDFPTYLKFILNFIKLFGAVLLWCKSLFSLVNSHQIQLCHVSPPHKEHFAGGMCAPKRQKFSIDNINQSLHNNLLIW